jgi:hypothetical protein
MKKLVLLALVAFAGYKAWDHYKTPELKPLYDQPYVVVYGREGCGFTEETVNRLRRARIQFEYLTVDDRATADELHTRMKLSGLDTSYYLLPVVDVNNSLSIRPENDELVTRAKAAFH